MVLFSFETVVVRVAADTDEATAAAATNANATLDMSGCPHTPQPKQVGSSYADRPASAIARVRFAYGRTVADLMVTEALANPYMIFLPPKELTQK